MNPDNRITPPAAGSHNLRRRGVLGGAGASVRCPTALFSRREDGPHRSSPLIAGSRLPRAPSSRLPARPILPRRRPLPQSGALGDASRPLRSSHRPSSPVSTRVRGSVPSGPPLTPPTCTFESCRTQGRAADRMRSQRHGQPSVWACSASGGRRFRPHPARGPLTEPLDDLLGLRDRPPPRSTGCDSRRSNRRTSPPPGLKCSVKPAECSLSSLTAPATPPGRFRTTPSRRWGEDED
jgi:hypothetical protein